MLLSDGDLALAIETGELKVDPFDPGLIQPSSIDMRLGDTFRMFNSFVGAVDPTKPIPERLTFPVGVNGDGQYILRPGQLVLATTKERVGLAASLAARLEGKSTLGRLGLSIHRTAGYIDPGFDGRITLELTLAAPFPMALTPGMLIGQLAVSRTVSPARRPYGSVDVGSHYQGQLAATPAQSLGPVRV